MSNSKAVFLISSLIQRSSFLHVLLTLVFLSPSVITAAVSPTENDLAIYAKQKSLISIPKISAALTTLMGSEDSQVLKQIPKSLTQCTADELHAVVEEGSMPGLAPFLNYVLVANIEGKLWVGLRLNADEVRYYTNDQQSVRQPPEAVTCWLNQQQAKEPREIRYMSFGKSTQVLGTSMFHLTLTDLNLSQKGKDLCTIGDEEFQTAELFSIITRSLKDKAQFFNEPKPCPKTGSCFWRRSGYLIRGDLVLRGRKTGNFFCTLYASGGNPVSGWIRTEYLPGEQLSFTPTWDQWEGQWKRRDAENESIAASITITRKRDKDFSIEGNAHWFANVGELPSKAVEKDGVLIVSDDPSAVNGCRVTLRLRGQFLQAQDNRQCGGLNVTFSGVYTKESVKGSGRRKALVVTPAGRY